MFITISLLLAAACPLPAVGKLTGNPKMRQSAAHFGIPWSRYRLIGVAELAAAAGVVIGLWWHPLGVAAAAGMALLLIGAPLRRTSPNMPSTKPRRRPWRLPTPGRPRMPNARAPHRRQVRSDVRGSRPPQRPGGR